MDFLKLLCERNYYAQVSLCCCQTWESYSSFSCMNSPKENDLLLFVNHCNITYRMKDGETISAKHGAIIFVPSGKEYTLTIDSRDREYGCTYGINFMIFDESHNRVFLQSNEVLANTEIGNIHALFKRMATASDVGLRQYAQLQAYFYQIIVALNDAVRKDDLKNYFVIAPGIRYLENDTRLSASIWEIAKMCNVSQSYFCRLFKRYSGMTPQEYVLKVKLEKAKVAIRETSLSVAQIALQCGFEDAAYFCRLFKKKVGVSPKAYRKSC